MLIRFTIYVMLIIFNVSYMYAGVYYVREDGDNKSDGKSWKNAFSSVQKAINTANYGDSVLIAQGEYLPEVASDGSNPRTKSFILKNGVKLIGGFHLLGNSEYSETHDGENFPTVLSGDLGEKGDTTDNAYHVIYNPLENPLDNSTELHDITISHGNADGENAYSSGGGMYLAQKSNLTLRLCYFKDNYAKSGAGIYNYGTQRIKLIQTVFENNRAINGAGIFNSFESKPEFSNCYFDNNKAKNGAAIYNSTGFIKIVDCQFENNLSGFGSTVYNYNCEVNFHNGIFKDNKSISNGGAIYSFSAIANYETVVFNSNESGQSGGAISDFNGSKSVFNNCTFILNNAAKDGGAFRSEHNSFAEFVNCEFRENNTDRNGGAIHTQDNSQVVINNSDFVLNIAKNYGGSVSAIDNSVVEIYDGFLKQNKALYGGGVAVFYDGNLIVKNTTIYDNIAMTSGGGVYCEMGKLHISNSTITENRGLDEGGGICAYTGEMTIDSCEIRENTSPLGAGVLFEKIDAHFINSQIVKNNGHGLLVVQCTPLIENCIFSFNENNSRGAAVYSLQGDATFNNCHFTNNKSTGKGRGGALYNYDSESSFNNCVFIGNEADYGGVMYNYKAIAFIDNCIMEENRAYTSGGAVSNWGDTCYVNIKNSKLSKNIAETGAAFYCSGSTSTTDVINSLIVYNNSEYFGGGFHNRMKAKVNIRNCTFSGNRSGKYGGAIYSINANTSMYNSILWDNFAETQANSIYSVDGISVIYSSCLPDSEADFYGDAKFYWCIYNDPQLAQKGDDPFAIYGSSPCVDAGNDDFVFESTDYAGLPRQYKAFAESDNSVDIGAYEYHKGVYPEKLKVITPTLVSPVNTAKYIPTDAEFIWKKVDNVIDYEIQLAYSLEFNSIYVSERTPDTSIVINDLERTTAYYWRVRAFNGKDTSNWSLVRKFNTVGEIIYVNPEATGNNTGVNWENAYTSFQTAIDSSGYCDSIFVAEGIYNPEKIPSFVNKQGERSKAFYMKNGVKMYGGFPGAGSPTLADRDFEKYYTILSGNIGDKTRHNDNCYHVVYNHHKLTLDTTSVLDGFIIADGYTLKVDDDPDSFGAGINNGDSNPTIMNCTFVNNEAFGGGGLFNAGHEEYYRGGPKVINCTFHNNRANKGGGGVRNYMSNLTIIDCNFTENNNGLHNLMSDATVFNCSFSNNTTAIMSVYSNPIIRNCTIKDNNIGVYNDYYTESEIYNSNILLNRYGVLNDQSESKIVNCNLTYNKTAIDNTLSDTEIINVSIIENEVGISSIGESMVKSNLNIYNTIVRNNSRDINISSTDSRIDNSCIPEGNYSSGYELTNIVYEMPKVYKSENSYWLLSFDSPCIDAGKNSFVPEGITFDIAGNDRIFNETVDIGAFEWFADQDTTSVNSITDIQLDVYPNPVSDYLNIKSEVLIKGIEMFDYKGNKIKTINYRGNQIDLRFIPSGFYILKINGLEKSYFKNIIIRR